MTAKSKVLRKAEFNPRIRTYLLLYGTLITVCTIVGIVLLPFYSLWLPC